MTDGLQNHLLRFADGEQRIVEVALPAGETLFASDTFRNGRWDPIIVSDKYPQGLATFGEVEYLIDGQLYARGMWPNLALVDAP